ncbi:predicted protein [Chaetomium globosum CBS 148.51]|uniref:Uncharacterized protein n=1 Tax=Chaetomium globosum (strain ATCC 6205 / CBS 148.51 / DSM 1962 / NBRC 6347 / NRRL 1970) TaxID=306901 RepID=Q2GP04_CHAGB|nr:uncharacterized protein CHGG_10300 [Chaetomium globosum CBS 148.51]EAQ83896.1 predicted protein [Chaetomium globosum CBS 148.51]
MEKESAKRRGAPWSRRGQRAGAMGALETGPTESGGSEFMVAPSTRRRRTLTSPTSLGASIVKLSTLDLRITAVAACHRKGP